ncbi:MAG: hypothetical protein M3548_14195 [Actinomycetota bacterium]|nr:hypothetical protein [Actinomycetota bacterium]
MSGPFALSVPAIRERGHQLAQIVSLLGTEYPQFMITQLGTGELGIGGNAAYQANSLGLVTFVTVE